MFCVAFILSGIDVDFQVISEYYTILAGENQYSEAGGRGALFASSVSLTSPLRSEVPEKTKVATSISRSIPFRPVPSKPHVSGRNADASKSGRILRFSRRSTGREKPPRPCHITLAGRGVAPSRNPRVRYVVLIIIANIRNEAGFRL